MTNWYLDVTSEQAMNIGWGRSYSAEELSEPYIIDTDDHLPNDMRRILPLSTWIAMLSLFSNAHNQDIEYLIGFRLRKYEEIT